MNHFLLKITLIWTYIVDIELNAELILDNDGNPIFIGRTYYKEVTEIQSIIIPITIDNRLYKNIIKPNERTRCIEIKPVGNIIQRNWFYDLFSNIPIVNKLKILFKKFSIKDTDGNILLTIDNIKAEDIIKENVSAGRFVLEFVLK
jgi:hypothetical protein